ncbi:MAG: DEAD/DEAH box helicase [Piscinibacter sp.]|nr:DEAD/DEAH box helicase [Piscinibacter sp.]
MSFDSTFAGLGLHDALTRALTDAGYENATEVQARAIPPALQGRDLMVASSTGSGKTASFVIPALARILAARAEGKPRDRGVVYGPRVLVLAPTRELALQVAKAATVYGRHVQGLRVATVLGGVPYPLQIKALRGPLDILIATPGRLLDHLQTGKAVLDNVEILVLDEADRMLDMGFIDDITTIAEHTPKARQTLMYSATFAGSVGRLAQQMLRDAQKVDVSSHTDTHANIEQRLHWADNGTHKNALLDHILTTREVEQALVFTSTQRDADWLADRLADMGHAVASLHGAMPQGRRTRTLTALRRGELRVLVATDVAARGIDVPSISHVINYGLPMKAEDYVHRIGRTGRAGKNGLAVTLAERGDTGMIRRIQHFTTQNIPVATIAGLEPRSPEPRMFAPARPEGSFGRPGGRPGGPGKSYGKPFTPRGGDRFPPQGEGRFVPRSEGRFVARAAEGFAPRAGEAFAPRKPAAPGARPGGFKPQRPRQGGYGR